MNNVKTREETAILRQKELTARNNYTPSFMGYYEASENPTTSQTISCGDDRLYILEDVAEAFNDNPNISYPEEVQKQDFENNIDEYNFWVDIIAFADNIKSKANDRKVNLGIKLADDFKRIQKHINLKSEKIERYRDVAKTASAYDDPNGKRKDTNIKKKREKRELKKLPPKA